MKNIPAILALCLLAAAGARAQRGAMVIPAGDTLRVPAGQQICADTIRVFGVLHCDDYDCLCRPVTVECFGTCLPGGVPVDLLNVSALRQTSSILLRWKTAAELDNAGFEIQRRTGENWIVIGFVPGRGTTATESRYAFEDPTGGMIGCPLIRYRLRQIDFDGGSRLSPEVAVELESSIAAPSLRTPFPNPANGEMTVGFLLPREMPVDLRIHAVTGALVRELRRGALHDAGYHAVRVGLAGLPGGVYLLCFSAGGITRTERFVIRK